MKSTCSHRSYHDAPSRPGWLRWVAISVLASALWIQTSALHGAEGFVQPVPSADAIKSAVARSIPLLEQGSRISMERRARCYTCHNQGLVVMALTAARDRGFTIDTNNLQNQLQFTADFLAKNKDGYSKGQGQGGGIDTAGYALWTLELGGWKPDSITAATTEYLTVWQTNRDHLEPTSIRPPTQKSHFTSTHAALRGLRAFGVAENRERIERRISRIRPWLLKTPTEDTEDRVFRLRSLKLADANQVEIQRAATELRQTQRTDGGWSQLTSMESDAYATGTALVTLHEVGGLAITDEAYRRGLKFLLSKQLEDGSWHVKTRATPVQEYYESGYPHGEDQFISIYAAGWSTTALALALPKVNGRAR